MMPDSPRSRLVGRMLVVGFLLLGLGELGLHIVHAQKSPRPEEWALLKEPVAQEKHPGDVVIVAPSWADPWARQTLGNDVFSLRDVARSDISRYATALEIGALGQTSSELRDFREISRKQAGPFTLRRLENPNFVPTVIDFVDRIAAGQAEVLVSEPEAKCPFNKTARPVAGGLGGHPTFPAARFECPGGVFFNVSETVIADQDFRPRRCIWAHPPNKGAVRIRFSDVSLGQVLRGHGGMYWLIERDKPGVPVIVDVRVDGQEIGRYEHKDGDGWSQFEMPLGGHAGKKNATVEFNVSARNNLHRHFCFEAHSR